MRPMGRPIGTDGPFGPKTKEKILHGVAHQHSCRNCVAVAPGAGLRWSGLGCATNSRFAEILLFFSDFGFKATFVRKSGNHPTNDWSDPEQPQLADRPALHKDGWPC